MRITDISNISISKNRITRLHDKKNNLAIAVSLAAGLAWKDKVLSFYEVIAKELLETFDDHLLDGILLDKFNKNYVKILLDDKTVYFNRNNLFLNTYEQLELGEWLKQELLIVENKELPSYLTSDEKESLFKNMTQEEIYLVNRNYNRQELNSNRFLLNLIKSDETKLINALTKVGYFSLSIYDYVQTIATGNYEYGVISKDKRIIYFKNTYNNYILELGAYISKVIEKYLSEN